MAQTICQFLKVSIYHCFRQALSTGDHSTMCIPTIKLITILSLPIKKFQKCMTDNPGQY